MTLPFAFLLGLAVVFGSRELIPPIPGNGGPEQLLPFAALLCLPSLLVACSSWWLRQNLIRGRRGRVPPRTMLRISALATPLVLWLLFAEGGYGDFVERWVGGSHFATNMFLMLPVLAAELPRIAFGITTIAHCEIDEEIAGRRSISREMLPGAHELWPVVRVAMGWPLLLVMPLALLGLLLDALSLDRESYVFFLGTTAGSTLSTLAFLGIAAALLPFWFRIAFGVVRSLPEPTGTQLRHTATRLGFDPRRVLLLPTGMRAMNAMMVGPLPVGRFLCVTDGLVRALDADSLTGVVGHEVGHAKRGHPGLTPGAVDDPRRAGAAAADLAVAVAPPRRDRRHDEGAARARQPLAAADHRAHLGSPLRARGRCGVGAGARGRALHSRTDGPVAARGAGIARTLRPRAEPAPRGGAASREHAPLRVRTGLSRGLRCEGNAAAIRGVCGVGAGFRRRGHRLGQRVALRTPGLAIPRRRLRRGEATGDRGRSGATALGEDLEAIARRAGRCPRARATGRRLAGGHGSAARRCLAPRRRGAPELRACRRETMVLVGGRDCRSRDGLQRAVYDFCQAASEHDTERMHELKQAVQRLEIPKELVPVFRE
jgi:hypothetical protein